MPPRGRPSKSRKGLAEPSTSEDRSALGALGEEQAAAETGGRLGPAAKDVSRNLEIMRDLDWASGSQTIQGSKKITAAVLQRRGDVQQPGCARCKKSGKTFKSCVAAPMIKGAAFLRGSCANCVWESKDRLCSLMGSTMQLDERTLGQFLGDGDSLRAVIEAEEQEEQEEEEEEEEEVLEEEEEEEEEEESNRNNSSNNNNGTSSRNVQTVPSNTFFGAFVPDIGFARVGLSQDGPRCQFDGMELKFPISRDIWENSRLLLGARSDLAHFVSIVDARLYELGTGPANNADYCFWQNEAQRMPALYEFPKSNKNNPLPVNPPPRPIPAFNSAPQRTAPPPPPPPVLRQTGERPTGTEDTRTQQPVPRQNSQRTGLPPLPPRTEEDRRYQPSTTRQSTRGPPISAEDTEKQMELLNMKQQETEEMMRRDDRADARRNKMVRQNTALARARFQASNELPRAASLQSVRGSSAAPAPPAAAPASTPNGSGNGSGNGSSNGSKNGPVSTPATSTAPAVTGTQETAKTSTGSEQDKNTSKRPRPENDASSSPAKRVRMQSETAEKAETPKDEESSNDGEASKVEEAEEEQA